MTSDLKLPEYAHRRCSLEGKVSPAQLYKHLRDKTAVFTGGADSSNAMVRDDGKCVKVKPLCVFSLHSCRDAASQEWCAFGTLICFLSED